MFQKETREIIDKVAAKVYDPEGKYTNVQKAEYAHIYYFFIKDFQLMPYDKEQGYRVLTDEQKNVEKKLFIVADMITDEYFKFFKDIPDGDILIPMIEEFLYNLDEEDEKFIRKFGQLDESRYFQAFMNEIRDVKEKIFNTGKWLNGDFMRLSTFQKLPENRVLDMLRIYEKYQESYEWKAQASKEKRVLFKNQGYQKIEYPQFIEGNTAFASESEMMQFLALMEFLKNEMPNMEFHKRSISECGFLEVKLTYISRQSSYCFA